jgi:hypothetical protein
MVTDIRNVKQLMSSKCALDGDLEEARMLAMCFECLCMRLRIYS